MYVFDVCILCLYSKTANVGTFGAAALRADMYVFDVCILCLYSKTAGVGTFGAAAFQADVYVFDVCIRVPLEAMSRV